MEPNALQSEPLRITITLDPGLAGKFRRYKQDRMNWYADASVARHLIASQLALAAQPARPDAQPKRKKGRK